MNASLRAILISEYLSARPDILAGRRKVYQMTDREQAGLYLTSFGAMALAVYLDTPELARAAIGEQWPGVERLLLDALNNPIN